MSRGPFSAVLGVLFCFAITLTGKGGLVALFPDVFCALLLHVTVIYVILREIPDLFFYYKC